MASATGESALTDGSVCSICLDVFTSPRKLPCMHSFCQKCLQDYISKTVDSKGEDVTEFVCPVCRAITSIPKTENFVGKWASLYPLSQISVTKGSEVKVERYCNGCQYAGESKSAQGFCVVCEESLCNACLTAHQRAKATRDHKVISIEELTSTPEHQIRFAEGFGCPDHKDKHVEYYCQSHEAVCCGDCFFSDHRTCDQVKSLSKDLPSLLSDLMPGKIIEQMKKIEKHLQSFSMTNETNICKLDATMNNFVDEIRAIRMNVNKRLDEIERMVTTEGCQIYKEEMIRRQEENHQCQNFINTVKCSYTFLESIMKYGTDTQKFLVSKMSVEQLKSYVVQVREKFMEIETVTVQLELGGFVNEIQSADLSNIARLNSKVYRKNFPCYDISESQVTSSTRRPRQESQVKFVDVVDIQSPGKKTTFYSGGVQLPGGHIVLADHSNKTCILYDSTYQFITSYTLPSHPKSMCLVHDHEIAVTLTDMTTIQLLSIRDKFIKLKGTVKSRYLCYGVVAMSRDEVVVTGPTDDRKGCYWSIVSMTTGEKCLHEFYCHRIEGAYITLDNSKSRVYISVELSNSVYCFGVTDARQYFAYTSNDLQHPLGVAVDKEDNVYVVGHTSQNIHKLSPEGTQLQIITSGIPQRPIRIFFDKNRERFIVTNRSDNQSKKLHIFRVQ